jgi:hypothetical protein
LNTDDKIKITAYVDKEWFDVLLKITQNQAGFIWGDAVTPAMRKPKDGEEK